MKTKFMKTLRELWERFKKEMEAVVDSKEWSSAEGWRH